jgi:tungstate transport system permease protein
VHDFVEALITAVALVGGFDPEIVGIIGLSLRVSLSASAIAMMIGAPLGGVLAISRLWRRHTVVVLVNALIGLPPVVVGLAIERYLPSDRPRPDPEWRAAYFHHNAKPLGRREVVHQSIL